MSPNPSGANQFYEPEPKYGDIKKKQELTKAAPISGAPVSAIATPQRAQAQAVGGSRKASKGKQASAVPPAYPVELAATWTQVAALPGASPLVQTMAQKAAQQVNTNGS